MAGSFIQTMLVHDSSRAAESEAELSRSLLTGQNMTWAFYKVGSMIPLLT